MVIYNGSTKKHLYFIHNTKRIFVSMKKQTLLLLILVILVTSLSLSYWPNSNSNNSPDKPPTKADYFFDNVSIKRFDSNGKVINRLSAKKLEHFKNSQISQFTLPKIQVKSQQDKRWNIISNQAKLDHSDEKIELIGQVKIAPSDNSAGSIKTKLTTQQLSFDLNANSAQTEHGILLTTSDSQTRAQKMFADFTNEKIKFSGNSETLGFNHAKK